MMRHTMSLEVTRWIIPCSQNEHIWINKFPMFIIQKHALQLGFQATCNNDFSDKSLMN